MFGRELRQVKMLKEIILRKKVVFPPLIGKDSTEEWDLGERSWSPIPQGEKGLEGTLAKSAIPPG